MTTSHKNPVSTPTSTTPKTSANNPHKISSTGVTARRTTSPTHTGSGKPARSNFPFAVNGNSTNTTTADGTM
ncbi:hypothetical protein [Paractinoplanes durhamensis]|uniref:hypothetical protein n=1 Tax=Paractinoplanes durhamensis TaxID=113563 RepID=UPI0036361D3D